MKDRRRFILVSLGCAVAALASFTHAFTVGADLVTAIPVIIGGLVVVPRVATTPRSVADLPAEDPAVRPVRLSRWALGWLALFVAVAGWELYCYVSTPRSQHPTLSSLIDMLDATQTGKGIAFLLWLALGWYLVAE